MNTTERSYAVVKDMLETQAVEVYDFATFLEAKRATLPEGMSAEQARMLRAERQALVASQFPQTESPIRQLRDGALLMVHVDDTVNIAMLEREMKL